MNFALTIKNYRNFGTARIDLVEGQFTALVGKNNAGKSTILRMFYELSVNGGVIMCHRGGRAAAVAAV